MTSQNFFRTRNHDCSESNKHLNTKKQTHSGLEVLNKNAFGSDMITSKIIKPSAETLKSPTDTQIDDLCSSHQQNTTQSHQIDLNNKTNSNDIKAISSATSAIEYFDNNEILLKKRNVNWHSPVTHYAVVTEEKQQQTTPLSPPTPYNSASETTTSSNNSKSTIAANGSSSSNTSRQTTPTKTVRIDHCVQEFYDDLVVRTVTPTQTTATTNVRIQSHLNVPSINEERPRRLRNQNEDDGFESLNGKSSSGEDNQSPLPSTSNASSLAAKNQLRLRLNAGVSNCNLKNKEPETKLSTSNSCNFRRNMATSLYDDEHEVRKTCSTPILINNVASSTSEDYTQTKKLKARPSASSEESDEDVDDGETISSPASCLNNSNYNECTTSATEWLGVTTNSMYIKKFVIIEIFNSHFLR